MRKLKFIVELLLLLGIIFISPLAYVTLLSMDEEVDNRIPQEYFDIDSCYNDSCFYFR